MRFKVLISAPYFQPVVQDYKSLFLAKDAEMIVPRVHERLSENELLGLIEGVHGVICGDDCFTKKVLLHAKSLRVISKWGTGIDSIDQAACKELGIVVRNTPNAFTVPVSDTVLAYALGFCRNITAMDRNMKAGVWNKTSGFSLSEATVGIIGYGNIGRAVEKKLFPFGCKILKTDLNPVSDDLVSLEKVLTESDLVSLNCDLNTTSFHLINKTTLSMMKPTAFLINTARGPIVEESALIDALRKKTLAGAALDVFENEPLPQDSPLRSMDQVFLAPHNSNSSPTAWKKVHESTVHNLFEELEKSSV